MAGYRTPVYFTWRHKSIYVDMDIDHGLATPLLNNIFVTTSHSEFQMHQLANW